MPTVKTVSVTYERKHNLGDYNSATVGCTLWADVDPEEDLDQAMKGLWECAKNNVKVQSLPLISKIHANLNIQEMFLGLPIEQQGD